MRRRSGQKMSLSDRVMKMVFSGRLAPGSNLFEKDLAAELGVSRTPIREALAKLVGHGSLVAGPNGHGVRIRDYSCNEAYQAYEYRALLEGGAAAAASAATPADLARMEMIVELEDAETAQCESYGSERWAELDYAFHVALAEASHNERIAHSLKFVLAECHYLFYLLPTQRPSPEEAMAEMNRITLDHRSLLELIRAGDAHGAEARARADMRKSGRRVRETLVSMALQGQMP